MSNKIAVVKFQPEHLQQIELSDIPGQGDCPKTVVTMAFTVMLGTKVIAILGAFPFVPGVIHFWAFMSKYVSERPIDFHKTCLNILTWYEKNEKPRRIQFDIRTDHPMAQRWAESLGLVREGLLRRWNPDGSDSYLYARVNLEGTVCQPRLL